MDRFGEYGYARTLHNISTIDDNGNDIVIPKGTIVFILDMFEKSCIVEFGKNDGIMMDIDEIQYEDIEPISEEEVNRIAEEEKIKS